VIANKQYWMERFTYQQIVDNERHGDTKYDEDHDGETFHIT
jgi:hypothetical protein